MSAHPLIEKKSESMAKGIVWNLDGLYQGHDDPTLHHDLEAVREKTESFVSSYRGKINDEDLDAQTLLSAIQGYESIHELGMKTYAFASLYHASDVCDPKRTGIF